MTVDEVAIGVRHVGWRMTFGTSSRAPRFWCMLLWLCVACRSEEAPPTYPTGEFLITASAIVQPRVVNRAGVVLPGASVIAITPGVPGSALHLTPAGVTDTSGRIALTIGRIGQRPVPIFPDTITAELITRLSAKDGRSQVDSVVLRFSPRGATPAPSEVEVMWRGSTP